MNTRNKDRQYLFLKFQLVNKFKLNFECDTYTLTEKA